MDVTADYPGIGDTGGSVAATWVDIDNDGRLDLYVGNIGSANRMFHNEVDNGNHWLQLKLTGVVSNRTAIGSRVRIVTDGQSQIREIASRHGYVSQGTPEVEVGLGSYSQADTVEITWPSGIVQTLTDVGADQLLEVIEPVETLIQPLPQASGPISCDDQVTVDFRYSPAPDTPAMRAYSVRVTATSAVSFTASDITVYTLPPGDSAVYEVIENGPNDFTIDYTILGVDSEGIATESDLFSVTFTGADDGVGTIAMLDGDFRDLDNQSFLVDLTATATVVVDCGPPGAVAESGRGSCPPACRAELDGPG